MKIQQIRNATIIIEYAGKKFLVDPMLGKKGSFAPFPFSHHQELRNPLHDLPLKAEEIVNNIDCILLTKVSHLPFYWLSRIIKHCNILIDNLLTFRK